MRTLEYRISLSNIESTFYYFHCNIKTILQQQDYYIKRICFFLSIKKIFKIISY